MNLRRKIENLMGCSIALLSITGIVLQRGDLLFFAIIAILILTPFVWRRAFPRL